MRILQLIDSLDAGGAERVAVNFANSLLPRISFSALATARKEGVLKKEIAPGVGYVFLEKSGRIGLNACKKLKSYCESHQITHIHAHGTSFFTALIVKFMLPKIKLVWHNHNGRSESIAGLRLRLMRFASKRFSGILSVNEKLNDWSVRKLHCPNTRYLPNFVLEPTAIEIPKDIKGENGNRILCVANLRDPKGHVTLLSAMEQIRDKNWTLHLVGKDYKDAYSRKIEEFIHERKLSDVVYLYGSREDTSGFVKASEICVLSSDSEGLPLALLEYGIQSKAVVTTAVGEIPNIVTDSQNGFVVPSGMPSDFADALVRLIEAPNRRETFGSAFRETVVQTYSEAAVIDQYLNWLKTI